MAIKFKCFYWQKNQSKGINITISALQPFSRKKGSFSDVKRLTAWFWNKVRGKLLKDGNKSNKIHQNNHEVFTLAIIDVLVLQTNSKILMLVSHKKKQTNLLIKLKQFAIQSIGQRNS